MANGKMKLIPTWMLILMLYYINTNTDYATYFMIQLLVDYSPCFSLCSMFFCDYVHRQHLYLYCNWTKNVDWLPTSVWKSRWHGDFQQILKLKVCDNRLRHDTPDTSWCWHVPADHTGNFHTLLTVSHATLNSYSHVSCFSCVMETF